MCLILNWQWWVWVSLFQPLKIPYVFTIPNKSLRWTEGVHFFFFLLKYGTVSIEYLWKHASSHAGWPLLFHLIKKSDLTKVWTFSSLWGCWSSASCLQVLENKVSPCINRWVFHSSWWELSPSVPRMNSLKKCACGWSPHRFCLSSFG